MKNNGGGIWWIFFTSQLNLWRTGPRKSLIFKCCSPILKTEIAVGFFIQPVDTYQHIDPTSSIEANLNPLARPSIIDKNRGKWKI